MLEADNQERKTPIELGSGEKEKIQISDKRFTRSLYSDRTGGYAGKQRLLFPIFCLIVGLPLLGFGIFAIVTMDGDDRVGAAMIGFCFGGTCNFLGIISLLAYFNGTYYQPTGIGGERTSEDFVDWGD
jgi:hypothetical protein